MAAATLPAAIMDGGLAMNFTSRWERQRGEERQKDKEVRGQIPAAKYFIHKQLMQAAG